MKNSTNANPVVQANFKNAKLLLIEDNLDHGTIIKDCIGHCLPEVKTILVTTEDDAITYLNRCSIEEWELPRMILLDLYLPDRQNGWRLLEQIKSMPASLGKIPVVLLSQSTNKDDISEAYLRGCSSYLVKPRLSTDWLGHFQSLRTYWWETVSLPKIDYSF